jgi:hypothetical protein
MKMLIGTLYNRFIDSVNRKRNYEFFIEQMQYRFGVPSHDDSYYVWNVGEGIVGILNIKSLSFQVVCDGNPLKSFDVGQVRQACAALCELNS